MRRMNFFAAFLLATVMMIGFAHAATGVECVRAQCEGKGRKCIEALYATYNTCIRAARAKCDSVSPAEKFNCLRDGLKPCAVTRNEEQATCLSDVAACYRACGPFRGNCADYWCVADFSDGATAAFCVGDPATSSPAKECGKAFNKTSPGIASMTCDPLR